MITNDPIIGFVFLLLVYVIDREARRWLRSWAGMAKEPKITCGKCGRVMNKSRRGIHKQFCDTVDVPGVMARLFINNPEWTWIDLARHYGKDKTTGIVAHVKTALIPDYFQDEAELSSDIKRRLRMSIQRNKKTYDDNHLKRVKNIKASLPECRVCTIRANRKGKPIVGPDGLCPVCRGDDIKQTSNVNNETRVLYRGEDWRLLQ